MEYHTRELGQIYMVIVFLSVKMCTERSGGKQILNKNILQIIWVFNLASLIV